MLEDLVILVIVRQGSLIRPLSLGEVFLFFVEQTDLEQGINFSFIGEGIGKYRILEVVDRLVDLVSLREDDAELVQDFRLLVEVGRHLQNSNKRRYGVVIGLKLFVEYADAVPQLGVFDVFHAVECMLVRIESLMDFIGQKAAVT